MWKNPRPSSPRFFRPIKIEFVRETVEVSKNVVSNIKNQIKSLSPCEKTIEEKLFQASFNDDGWESVQFSHRHLVS